MKPDLSYTIWFSQRTGSTLLNTALTSTGVAGNPMEWLYGRDPGTIKREDVERWWAAGTTSNGLFGIKTSFKPEWIRVFRDMFRMPETATLASVWGEAFPNCRKHIYMTRRNKVRLAVSWWRAIVSGEWHRQKGELPPEHDLADKYRFDAIQHLLIESSLREAALEQFFTESGIVPLTIVYEDFVLDYEGTVRKVLDFLEIPSEHVTIAPPALDKLADDAAEQWVQRFRQESQANLKSQVW